MNPAQTELELVFRECADELGRYFTRRHGPLESKDLVQESFLQLARSKQAGREIGAPRAYLFGIARYLSLAFWRRARRTEELRPEVAEAIPAHEPDGNVAAAREVMAALPDLQREILDLRFSHGLSYAEIAEVLGIPVGTVRSRLHHAVAMLRARLDADAGTSQPEF